MTYRCGIEETSTYGFKTSHLVKFRHERKFRVVIASPLPSRHQKLAVLLIDYSLLQMTCSPHCFRYKSLAIPSATADSGRPTFITINNLQLFHGGGTPPSVLFWQYINLQTLLANTKYFQIALAHEMRPYNAVSVSIPNLSLLLQSAARAGQSASVKDVIHFASKKAHLSARSSPRTPCSLPWAAVAWMFSRSLAPLCQRPPTSISAIWEIRSRRPCTNKNLIMHRSRRWRRGGEQEVVVVHMYLGLLSHQHKQQSASEAPLMVEAVRWPLERGASVKIAGTIAAEGKDEALFEKNVLGSFLMSSFPSFILV